ncbi:MAG: HEAT repeat domain-containing protein [Candidatus Melainabacteria bacterium]|nr:HEAT repeat domain-containing protein [Candidatus Melainabacteria bacterium]
MTRIISNAIKGAVGLVYNPKPIVLDKEHFLDELKEIGKVYSRYSGEEGHEAKVHNLREKLVQKYFRKQDEIVNWLSEVMSSEKEDIKYRCQAIKCFGHFRHKENIEHLINLLGDKSPYIREAAILTIGQNHNREKDRVLPLLVKHLNDPDFQVCDAAITALKYVGGKEGYDALHEFSKDYSDKRGFNREALLAMEAILWREAISSTPTKD